MATALLTPAATAHVFELAAPVYDDIAAAHALHARAPHDPVVIPVTLRRTGDDWIALVFSSKPRNLRKDVSCVNDDCGCRCNFVRLLRGMLMLIETETLQVQAAYVLRAFSTPLATIRLHVELHPNAGDELSSLIDFDLVLSHLHPALMLELPDHDAAQPQRRVPGKLLTTGDVQKQLEAAALTPCHVVGCALHEFKDGQIRSVQYSRNGAKLRLSDVFKSLMVPLEAHRMEVRDDESYVKRMKRAKRQLILTDLPTTALQQVLSLVDARDLAALSGVCSMFQHMAYEIVPGLHLTLYRHQQRALKWMLFREASIRGDTKPMPHPFMLPATPDAALGKALDLVDMKVLNSATPGARDVHGGLLCDEPGLGKTITMLSLILRTKGQRSSIAALRARQAQAQQATSSRKLRSGHVRGRHVSHEELLESAASLIVVPDPLVEHWKYQIRMHTQRGCLKVFVDEDTVLPPPQVLAKCDIVITSLGRLAKEWRYHRPASVLETRMPDRYGFEGPQRYTDGSVRGELSSLLRIHWVRCIVDEGHKLGGTTESDHIRMSRMFSAEKRWVMTGTPTPNTLQSADLRYLHGLLVFLRDKPFGEQDGKAWVRAIARPFEDNEKIGLVRLHNLLSRIMLRHTKKSVRELLPDPIRRTVIVDPSIAEYNCYNIVAAAVRLNLVATKYDPNMPGAQHPDSLLNPKNRKFAREVIRNLRAGSNGGNETLIYLRAKDHVETVQMLSKFGVSQDLIAEVATYLRHATLNISTSCGCCLRDLVLLTLVPCGHLVCADCVDERMQSQGASCAVCEKNFNYELFQKVQPGFQFDFPKDDPKNVTENVDEARLGATDGNNDPTAATNRSRTTARSRQQQRQQQRQRQQQQRRQRRRQQSQRRSRGRSQTGSEPAVIDLTLDDSDSTTEPPPPSPPRPELQPEPARSRNRARNNSEADSNLVPDHRPREHRGERQPINLALHFAPVEASKAYYVAKRILELRDEYAKRRREGFWDRSPSAARYPKAIVFSQFREHIWRTKILFAQNGVPCTDFIALRSPEFRMQQLQKFRSDPEASVLLMMDVGSHGLDLSFVTHIFLLEEIWDKSLELQVISRAHRMGAKQSVVVGQLVMRGTVEMTMDNYFKAGSHSESSAVDSGDAEQTQEGSQGPVSSSAALGKIGFRGGAEQEKTSLLQMQIEHVLKNLRLLDENEVTAEREVRFVVLDDKGVEIRRDKHRFPPRPGDLTENDSAAPTATTTRTTSAIATISTISTISTTSSTSTTSTTNSTSTTSTPRRASITTSTVSTCAAAEVARQATETSPRATIDNAHATPASSPTVCSQILARSDRVATTEAKTEGDTRSEERKHAPRRVRFAQATEASSSSPVVIVIDSDDDADEEGDSSVPLKPEPVADCSVPLKPEPVADCSVPLKPEPVADRSVPLKPEPVADCSVQLKPEPVEVVSESIDDCPAVDVSLDTEMLHHQPTTYPTDDETTDDEMIIEWHEHVKPEPMTVSTPTSLPPEHEHPTDIKAEPEPAPSPLESAEGEVVEIRSRKTALRRVRFVLDDCDDSDDPDDVIIRKFNTR